jgi:nicotinamidase-related amidase
MVDSLTEEGVRIQGLHHDTWSSGAEAAPSLRRRSKEMDIDPRRTSLVAVHLQGDVVRHDGAFGGFFAAMVDKTGVLDRSADLIGAARKAGSAVLYTRIAFSEGHPGLVVNNALFSVVDDAGCCVLGTPGTTIVDEVAPEPGDVIIDHHRVGGAHGSELVAGLRDRGIENVVVFGVATNISVEGTARQLVDEGFRTIVVADCCTAADDAAHEASLATLRLVASEVVDAAAVINALDTGVPA